MKQKEFKVLVMNPNTHMFEAYDILPFLRLMWEVWPYNVSFECGYVKVKTKESLKIWVQNKSVCHFWANKELEFLMAPSEFGSYKWRVDLKALIKTEPDKGKCTEDIILTKIDTKEMIQVSVHDQVKMNIDIITDILYEEFFMAKAEAFGMPTLALYARYCYRFKETRCNMEYSSEID